MSLVRAKRTKNIQQMEDTTELELPSIKEYIRKLETDSNELCLATYKNFLFSGGSSSIIQQWNCEGQCIRSLRGHKFRVSRLFVWKDHLYSGSEDSTIRVWSIITGTCLRVLNGHF